MRNQGQSWYGNSGVPCSQILLKLRLLLNYSPYCTESPQSISETELWSETGAAGTLRLLEEIDRKFFKGDTFFHFSKKSRNKTLKSSFDCHTYMDNNRQVAVLQRRPDSLQRVQISSKPETCSSKTGIFAVAATKACEGTFCAVHRTSGLVPLRQQKSYRVTKRFGSVFVRKGLLFSRQVSLANAGGVPACPHAVALPGVPANRRKSGQAPRYQ